MPFARNFCVSLFLYLDCEDVSEILWNYPAPENDTGRGAGDKADKCCLTPIKQTDNPRKLLNPLTNRSRTVLGKLQGLARAYQENQTSSSAMSHTGVSGSLDEHSFSWHGFGVCVKRQSRLDQHEKKARQAT